MILGSRTRYVKAEWPTATGFQPSALRSRLWPREKGSILLRRGPHHDARRPASLLKERSARCPHLRAVQEVSFGSISGKGSATKRSVFGGSSGPGVAGLCSTICPGSVEPPASLLPKTYALPPARCSVWQASSAYMPTTFGTGVGVAEADADPGSSSTMRVPPPTNQ